MTAIGITTTGLRSGASVEHPVWCDRASCRIDDSGYHMSYPMVLAPVSGDDASATVRLEQGPSVSGYEGSGQVLVELVILLSPFDPTDTGEEHVLALSGDRARALGRLLLSAGQAATRHGNQAPQHANETGPAGASRSR